ncbi:Vhr2p SKDI_05G1420 [Saccharomyces kudriavzevii IFO 1802]|uniref:VHR2-like protein n=1 Tax=Saccharomyces kudriavzevii (strain ATCC MYA-4449 / AS 2.2408 / CBS 8840 / NBRC 1802 / NCYC 2889) TaxID=226230 RepID=A0AA35NPT1_SACK1|nr:uncharacterized protein SKDI_05G1420 [Saccharomyces kudriavzevii IFO 1802]CAI4060268.1 hypothetical protein SKDI_05G1420 [Saccharomyces kudriavzevii IFO 1802]
MTDELKSSEVRSEGSHKTGKYNGYGTTHKIRAQLNFNDEKKWKKFSSRRLELIDSFGLSQHKASEQDDNIKQIATILRCEFEYPETSGAEFEKLVTAAVQSVRRNRKRSKKKLLCSKKKITSSKVHKIPLSPPSSSNVGSSCSASNASSSDEEASLKEEPRGPTLPTLNTMKSAKLTPYPSERSLPPVSTHMCPLLEKNSSPFLGSDMPNGGRTLRKLEIDTQPSTNGHNYDFIVRSLIVDIVNNTIPLPEQIQRDKFIRPNLTEKKGRQSRLVISNNLRKLILSKIHNSRTCLDISKDEKHLDFFTNLEILGQSSLRASISFVVESSFSHLPPSTRKYLTGRLSSIDFLSVLSQRLFTPATRQIFADLSQEKIQVRVLDLILGSLVKDYGFDASLAPINEIIYHMTLHQYPLVCIKKQPNVTATNSKSEVPSKFSSPKSMSAPNKRESQFNIPNTSARNADIKLASIESSNTYEGDGLRMLSAISLQIEKSKLPGQFRDVPQ